MKCSLSRATLLKLVQTSIGAVAKRHTLPILTNLLIVAKDNKLTLTGTNLEAEIVCSTTDVEITAEGQITVPAKKLADILRALPDESDVLMDASKDQTTMILKQGARKYSFQTLPATDFPNLEEWQANAKTRFVVDANVMANSINNTAFAMASQDVRYYLNGMYFDICKGWLYTVATDGHRMAMAKMELDNAELDACAVIVPRDVITEIMKMLGALGDRAVDVMIGQNHIRFSAENISLTSKLVDGRFPDYRRVIPRNNTHHVLVNRTELEAACARSLVLSNEKFRGTRMEFNEHLLTLHTHNAEHETAEEPVEISVLTGDFSQGLEIGFNLNYLVDALRHAPGENVVIELRDSTSSALVYAQGDDTSRFVLMPMRL